MNYKKLIISGPPNPVFNKSTNDCSDEDEFEIDPEIFYFIEEVILQKSEEELLETLTDFEKVSKYISRHYIPTFGQTSVPSKLVELLICPNATISCIVSRIVCSLITPNTPEYAEDLCENNFLNQCSYILNRMLNNPSLIYSILVSLSNLASFSSAKCDLILSHIKFNTLAFYAQSKSFDESLHDELLRFLVILSSNNINDIITDKLIELVQSIFSDFINYTRLKRYRILQLIFFVSKYPKFYDDFFIDNSSTKQFEISTSTEAELYFLIPILTNFLNHTDYDFHRQLIEISQQLSLNNFRIIKLSCRFIQDYLAKYSVNEDEAEFIMSQLIEIIDTNCMKEKREILFCICDIILLIHQDTLIEIIYQSSLFEFFIDAIESNDDELCGCVLQTLHSLFQKYEEVYLYFDIQKKFIEEGGIDTLNELVLEINDDSNQIYEMAETILNSYLLFDEE